MQKYLNFWHDIYSTICEFLATSNIKKAFIIALSLYALALFALIRGDVYYIDDLASSITNLSWNHFSRYLATFILNDVTTFGKDSMDISPLLQIIGVIFVVASAMILLYLIYGKFDLLGIIASLPLGLSPFFLQNLSYKFESLFMGIALFFAIVPFLFKDKIRVFCTISVVLLLCMFVCYQAANAVYIIIGLYFALFDKSQKFKQNMIFLGICALNVIVASAVYNFIIAEPVSEYIVSHASNKIIPLNSHFFINVWANFATYATTIFNDLRQTAFLWLIAINGVIFIVIHRIKAFVFLALGFLASYGLYVVLQKPLFEPRAFYGFNAFIAIIAIANVSNYIKSSKIHMVLHYLSCATAIITAYFLISFANIYGNALTKQDEYLDFRAKLLLSDLSDKIPRWAMVELWVYIDNHSVAQRFINKYGGISRLIPKITDDDFWFHTRLRHLNAPYNFHNREICMFLKDNFGSEIIFKNAYHTIERTKSCYIIVMKNSG